MFDKSEYSRRYRELNPEKNRAYVKKCYYKRKETDPTFMAREAERKRLERARKKEQKIKQQEEELAEKLAQQLLAIV